MAKEHKLKFTGAEVEARLEKVTENEKEIGQLTNQIADQKKQIAELKDNGVAVSYDSETKTLNISSGVGG